MRASPRRCRTARNSPRELAARLEHAGSDEELRVDALRQFRRAATFRVAMQDLTGRLPLMQVSDRLTDVAELILEQALALAWRHTAAQYGEPRCEDAEGARTARVGIAGYGKLGGMELGYASDLDLVFLHDSAGERQQTAGPKVVDNEVFFLRLAQRLVHLLTVHTAAGRLYEVDVRLRPSGKGGLAFTQIGVFENYQRREAWTWEHQALLHSRWIAGDAALGAAFAGIRKSVLIEAVKRETLREEIVAMRERMRGEHARPRDDLFDLKQDRGGIADIEFLAQYWVLRHVARVPAARGISRHHPPARVRRLRGARGSPRDRPPGGRLPRVPASGAPPVAGAAPGGRGRAGTRGDPVGGGGGLGARDGRGRGPGARIIAA